MQKRRKSTDGFTVIELLVVMAIIGILMSIVVVSAQSSRERSRDNERKATLEELTTALEFYREKNGKYPCTNDVDASGNCSGTTVWYSSEPNDKNSGNINVSNGPTTGPCAGQWIPCLAPTYIPVLPRDPLGGQSKLGLLPSQTTYSACRYSKSAYWYKSTGTDYAIVANCSPERPIPAFSTYQTLGSNDLKYYYDPVRPSVTSQPGYAYKVYSNGAVNW